MTDIVFGTDGWRAILAFAFTADNVARVAAAVTRHVIARGEAAGGLVVGYDTRFMGERLAELAADVIEGQGVAATILAPHVPTPVIAHELLEHKHAGAIMFTASHNPPEYGGMKFLPAYGGPATTDITRSIEELIPPDAPQVVRGTRCRRTAGRSYRSAMRAFADNGPGAELYIVYDAMHGTGGTYVPELLRAMGARVDVLAGDPDPMFGGRTPEPIGEHLGLLREAVVARGADLGLATDGDADRFGCVDGDGTYLSPNQLLPLLARHLYRVRGLRGAIVRTVATTHLLDRVAEAIGAPLLETPVGFKYISEIMRNQEVLLGGEESGGLSIGGHLPEKDGILACLLLAELRAAAGQPLGQALRGLMDEVGWAETVRVDVPCEDGRTVVAHLARTHPPCLGGRRVERMAQEDGLKYYLEDGAWCLIRPSGTEALVRLYVEAADGQAVQEIVDEARARLREE